MRFKRLIPLALFGTGIVIATVLGRSAALPYNPMDVRHSTILSGPDNSKALADLLEYLGKEVSRRQRPWFRLERDSLLTLGGSTVISLLDPSVGMTWVERNQLITWVKRGGRIFTTGITGIERCLGFRVTSTARDTLTGRIFDGNNNIVIEKQFRFDRAKLDRDSATSRCIATDGVVIDTLLSTGRGYPALLRARFEQGGSIVLLSDGAILANQALRENPSVTKILPATGLLDAQSVVFDEYHHGFRQTGSLMATGIQFLLHKPLGWMILQLAAVVLIYILVSTIRFGPATTPHESRRRSELEHVDALASGLERAQAADTGARLLVTGLVRRLYGTSLRQIDDGEAMLLRLERSAHLDGDKESVRRLVDAMQLDNPDEKIVKTAAAVEEVWKQLSHKR